MSIDKFRGSIKACLLTALLSTLIALATHPAISQKTHSSPLSPLAQNQAAMVLPTPTIPPISPLTSPLNTPTSTPTIEIFTPTPSPTATPIPTPLVIDQAQGLSKEDTFTVMVERGDGQQEIYFVPISEVPLLQGEEGRSAYETYRQDLLQLLPGDWIVYECAAPSVLSVPEEYRCFGRKQVTLNTPP